LRLELSDAHGEVFAPREPRSSLMRIPFGERASEIERIAEELGFLLKQVRLEGVSQRTHRNVLFFA